MVLGRRMCKALKDERESRVSITEQANALAYENEELHKSRAAYAKEAQTLAQNLHGEFARISKSLKEKEELEMRVKAMEAEMTARLQVEQYLRAQLSGAYGNQSDYQYHPEREDKHFDHNNRDQRNTKIDSEITRYMINGFL